MATQPQLPVERRRHDPKLEERYETGHPEPVGTGTFRSMGLGLITGAADDDPSAIGTYASAGASLGPSFLWTAPVTFPMMFAVVYLCSKLGQVAGQGLFAVIRESLLAADSVLLSDHSGGRQHHRSRSRHWRHGGSAESAAPDSDWLDRCGRYAHHSWLADMGLVYADPQCLPLAGAGACLPISDRHFWPSPSCCQPCEGRWFRRFSSTKIFWPCWSP